MVRKCSTFESVRLTFLLVAQSQLRDHVYSRPDRLDLNLSEPVSVIVNVQSDT